MLEIQGDIGAYFSGGPIVIKQCNIVVEQPKVKDVMIFGENTFFTILEMLSDIDKFFEKIKDENPDFANINSYQLLMEFLQHPESMELRSDILSFLSLICPMYDNIKIEKNTIRFLMYDEDQKKDMVRGMINPMNQEEFGRTLQELFSAKNAVVDDRFDYNINKNNPKAVALEKKLRQAREKVERLKHKQRENKGSPSVLSVGLGQNLEDFLNLTLFQLFNLFHRWVLKRQSDIYEQGVTLNPWVSKEDIDEDNAPRDWTEDFYNNN